MGSSSSKLRGDLEHHWIHILSYLQPTFHDRILIRRLCKLFNIVEVMITKYPNSSQLMPIPSGVYTMFPHPNHSTLSSLIKSVNEVVETKKDSAPKYFFFQGRNYDQYELCNLNENCAIVDANGCFHFNHNVKENKLKQVALEYPQLRSINLSFCTEITNDCFMGEGEGWKNLQTLNLMYCKNITDSLLTIVGKKCQNLQTLNLSGCKEITNTGLAELAKRCPNLQTLGLRCCIKITDTGLAELAKGCTNLQTLDLTDCKEITDTGLAVLLEGCRYLQYLSLFECDRITDQYKKFLEEMTQKNKLKIDFIK